MSALKTSSLRTKVASKESDGEKKVQETTDFVKAPTAGEGGAGGTRTGDGMLDTSCASDSTKVVFTNPSKMADVVCETSDDTLRVEDPGGGGGGGHTEFIKREAANNLERKVDQDRSDQAKGILCYSPEESKQAKLMTEQELEQTKGVEEEELERIEGVEEECTAQKKETNGFDGGQIFSRSFPYIIMTVLLLATSSPLCIFGIIHLGEKGFLAVFSTGMSLGVCLVGVFRFMYHVRQERRLEEQACAAAMAMLNPASLQAAFRGYQLPGWAFLGTYDKADWLNRCIVKLWPHINKAASGMVQDQLQPILSMYTMGGITGLKVKSFTFGNRPPRVTGIKLIPGKGKITLQAQVDWRSRPQQKLKLEVKTIGPDFNVEVKKLRTYGVIHVVFTPLEEELPGFGALLFALKEEPQVDFDIKVLGGEVTALPGIDKMINGMIRTALLDMLVWPSRIVFPVGKGDYRNLQEHPVGRLCVVLREAKGLMCTDVLGKSDPFALLFVRQKRELMKRSTTKQDTLNPVWNEGFYIEVTDAAMQSLTVKIMDEELVEKAETIGSAVFPISQLQNKVPWEGWLDIHENPKRPMPLSRGRVHLKVKYEAYAPEVVTQKLDDNIHEADLSVGGGGEDMGGNHDGNGEGKCKYVHRPLWKKMAHVIGAFKCLTRHWR